MNIYVIVLGALLLIMMVTLGHHHRHSAADTSKTSDSGDPLVDKIEQYNNDKSRMLGFGNVSQGGASVFGGNQLPAMAPANNIIYPNQQQPYQQQNPVENSDSYYPPPAPGAPQSPLQQQQQAQPQSDQ